MTDRKIIIQQEIIYGQRLYGSPTPPASLGGNPKEKDDKIIETIPIKILTNMFSIKPFSQLLHKIIPAKKLPRK